MNTDHFTDYSVRLQCVLAGFDWGGVAQLAQALRAAWEHGHRVFICGNGGSAANAMHIANDLLYGISMRGAGIKAMALTANSSVVTCLANDLGYDEIFARQIKVQGEPNNVLIVLSGSGNSLNVVKALEEARRRRMRSFAILGYSGGKCLGLADVAIHFPVDDMQLSEDLQLVVGHMVMQWLCAHPVSAK